MADPVLRDRPRITSIGYRSSLTTRRMLVARADKSVRSIQIVQVTTTQLTIIKMLQLDQPPIPPCSMNPFQVVTRREGMDTWSNIVVTIITTIRALSMKSTMVRRCLLAEMKTISTAIAIIRTALIITTTRHLQLPIMSSTIVAYSHRNWQSSNSSTINTTAPPITQTASNGLKNCSKENWTLISRRKPLGSID